MDALTAINQAMAALKLAKAEILNGRPVGRPAKFNKRQIAEKIEQDYIRGGKTLRVLADEIGCTLSYVSIIGRELVEGYSEISALRRNPPVSSQGNSNTRNDGVSSDCRDLARL